MGLVARVFAWQPTRKMAARRRREESCQHLLTGVSRNGDGRRCGQGNGRVLNVAERAVLGHVRHALTAIFTGRISGDGNACAVHRDALFALNRAKLNRHRRAILLMANAFASASASAENDTTTAASDAIQRRVVRRKSMN